LTKGVFLVDAAGRILFANKAAETLLRTEGSLYSTTAGLFAQDPTAQQALRRLILGCAHPCGDGLPGGTFELSRGTAQAPLHIEVLPFRAEVLPFDTGWLGLEPPVAMLLIGDPEEGYHRQEERLRRRFGLTSAEADVALEIVKGNGCTAAAARLGIGNATVRTHLLRIFEKTGVHRQAELVHLLLNSQ